jgi:hypothetical protein
MESGKKPSIFSDRGTIGSAGELDEYGVWVKSEPEDITLDDGAFLSAFDETVEAVDGEEYGAAVEDGEVLGFDVDFGSAEQEATANTGEADIGMPDFNMDFGPIGEPAATYGEEMPAEEVAEGDTSSDFEISLDYIPDVPQAGAETAEPPQSDAAAGYDFEISLDDIPDVPQTGAEAGEQPQDGALQNELLLKIAGELSSIKAEINELKKEISTIRGENARAGGNAELVLLDGLTDEALPDETPAAESPLDEARSFEVSFDEPPAAEGLLDEVPELEAAPDETPAAESPLDEVPEFEATPDETPVAVSPLDDARSFEVSFVAPPVAESLLDEVPELEAAPDETPAAESPLDEVRSFEVSFDEPPAAESLLDEVPELEAAPDETPAAESPPGETTVSVDLDLRDDEAQDKGADGFELTAYETTDEIVVPFAEALEETAPEQPPATPDYLSPDELVAINEAKNAATPPVVVEADIPEAAPPLPLPAEEAAETPPEPPAAQGAPKTADAIQNGATVSPGFKKDLMAVLSYMDRLLEALPDEKIEEFARSEQFDVYKRLFTELGLA